MGRRPMPVPAENMKLVQLAGLHHVHMNFERAIEGEVGPGDGRIPPGRSIIVGIETVHPASLTRRPRAETEFAINVTLDPHDEGLALGRPQAGTRERVELLMGGFVGAGRSDSDIWIGCLGEGRRVAQRSGMTGSPVFAPVLIDDARREPQSRAVLRTNPFRRVMVHINIAPWITP